MALLLTELVVVVAHTIVWPLLAAMVEVVPALITPAAPEDKMARLILVAVVVEVLPVQRQERERAGLAL
jgi:hypothetical protein